MSHPSSFSDTASPIDLVRPLHRFDKDDQHHVSSASTAEPEAITPIAPGYRQADLFLKSSTDLSGFARQRPSNAQDSDSDPLYTSTSNEGTPRLRPVQNGSSDLLPFAGSSTDALDSPRRLSLQTIPTSLSNLSSFPSISPHSSETYPSKFIHNPNKDEEKVQTDPVVNQGVIKSGPYARELQSPITRPSTARYKNSARNKILMAGDLGDMPDNGLDKIAGGARTLERDRSTSTGSRGHVEKRIEATLADAEPSSNARSRKSSHMMQLFKDTSPEQKRLQEKKRQDSGLQTSGVLNEGRVISSGRSGIEKPLKNLPGEFVVEEDEAPNLPSTYVNVESQQQSPPEQQQGQTLLATSPTNYLPLADVTNESRVEALSKLNAYQSHGEHQIPYRLLEEIRDFPKRHPQVARGEEDDGSDKEQISSAIYYPHKGAFQTSVDDVGLPQPELAAPDVEKKDAFQDVDMAIKSQNQVRHFHGELHADRSHEHLSSRGIDSDMSSASGSDYSYTDAETTPKATPTTHGTFLGTRPRRGRRPQTVPVQAVELVPFNHQVGGHNTVWRLHEKGVCKTLTNGENEFYEVVEQMHPELLKFLPKLVVAFGRGP